MTEKKKTYLRARPKDEKTWVIDEIENKHHYEDDENTEYEFSTIEMTPQEKAELPEFTGW